jgi:mutator protein MutT
MRREFPDAPIVGVGAILIEENRVLLVRRGQDPLKGEWSLPGGVVELGESLEDALRREMLEETGLEVEPAGIIEVVSSIVRDDFGGVRYHYVIVDFLCRRLSGEARSGSDASELRWVAHEELNSHSVYRVAPITAAVIEKGFCNGSVSCNTKV